MIEGGGIVLMFWRLSVDECWVFVRGVCKGCFM